MRRPLLSLESLGVTERRSCLLLASSAQHRLWIFAGAARREQESGDSGIMPLMAFWAG